nr:PQQ-binding-like beta-propeller repeat protein [Candidatus Sigynarchaeota archaeon]
MGDEWPMFRGALNHTGVATTTPMAAGGVLWSFITGGYDESAPVVRGEYLYIGSGNSKLYCLNATTGGLLWSYTTGSYVISTPALSGTRIYLGSADNNIYCLNATTGSFLWSYTTGGVVFSSPAVAGGLVYVGSYDAKIYCLNASTGAFKWSFTTGGLVHSSPAVVADRVYVGSVDNKLYCLNATTGAFVWSYTTGAYIIKSSPAVANGRVYVGSRDCNLYCLNASTGALIWSYTTGDGLESSPAIAGGYVYVGSWDAKLHCLNATTGVLVWSYNTGGIQDSSPAVTGGRIYVGSLNSTVYCLPMIWGNLLPSAPQNFQAPCGNGQVSLSWTPPASNGTTAVVAYEVFMGTTPGNESWLWNVTTTNYMAMGLTNGVTYYFKVAAVNGAGVGPNSTEIAATPMNLTSSLSISSFTLRTGNGTFVGGSAFVVRVAFSNTGGLGVDSITEALDFGGYAFLTANASSSITVGAGSTGTIDFLITALASATTSGVTISANWSGTEETTGNPLSGGPSTLAVSIKAQASLAITSFTWCTGNQTYVAGMTLRVRVSLSNPATSAKALTVTALLSFGGATGISANASASKTISGAGYNDFLITIDAGAPSQPTVAITTTVSGTEEISGRALGPLTRNLVIFILAQAALTITGAPTLRTGNGTYVAGTTLTMRVSLNNPATSARALTVTATLSGLVAGVTANTSASKTISGAGYIDFLITIAAGTASQSLSITASVTGAEYISARALSAGPSAALNITVVGTPSAPQTLTTIPGSNQVVLNWTPPASDGGSTITNYSIYVGTAPGGETLNTTVGVVLTCTVTNLHDGQVYYFKVAAINAFGQGSNSTEASATPGTGLFITSFACRTGNGTYVGGMGFVVRVSFSNTGGLGVNSITAALDFGGYACLTTNASSSITVGASSTGIIDFLITALASATTSGVTISANWSGTEQTTGNPLSGGPSTLAVSIKAQASLAITFFSWCTGNQTYVAGMTLVMRVSLNNPATSAKAFAVTATLSGLVAGVTANASASKTISGAGYIDFLITIAAGTASQALSITATVSGIEEITARALSAGPSRASNITILAQAALTITGAPTFRTGNGTYVAGTTFVVRVSLNNPATSAK